MSPLEMFMKMQSEIWNCAMVASSKVYLFAMPTTFLKYLSHVAAIILFYESVRSVVGLKVVGLLIHCFELNLNNRSLPEIAFGLIFIALNLVRVKDVSKFGNCFPGRCDSYDFTMQLFRFSSLKQSEQETHSRLS